MSLSNREIIECRYIETFSISKSISYRYAFILSFSAKNSTKIPKILQKIPKILRKLRKFSENSEISENSPKILKIPQKEGLFLGQHIVSILYRIE